MNHLLYSLLVLLIRVYFRVVNAVLALYNSLFKTYSHAPFPSRNEPDDEIYFLSVVEAAKRIRDGKLTSRELVEAYVDRVRLMEPYVKAVVFDCFEEALAQASAVDTYLDGIDRNSEEFSNLATTKPLLGVPFTVKNNIDVSGYRTLVGNPAFLTNPPATADARVVHQLRQAGGIPLAITTMPCLAWGCDTWDAINRRYTRNPYDLRRTSGGSSGGEGALVGSGASMFGLGNDSGGSVRSPATMCGCFGFKPTAGLVSLDGMVPTVTAPTMKELWSIGPLCRYASDLSTILRCMLAEPQLADTKLQLSQPVDLSRLRLFYMEKYDDVPACEPVQADVKQTLEKVRTYFELKYGLHAHRVGLPLSNWVLEMCFAWVDRDEPAPCDSLAKIALDTIPILLGQSATCTLASIAIMEWRLFNHILVPTVEVRRQINEKRAKLRAELKDLLAGDSLLLLPAFPKFHPPFNGSYLVKRFHWLYTGLSNVLGFPAITVPVGVDQNSGLPTSIQLVGRPYNERVLIAAAKELERGFGGWSPISE